MTSKTQSSPLSRIHSRAPFLVSCFLLLTSLSAASTIEGMVINSSRNQPSSGDEVVLYSIDQTMHEVNRTKSDALGSFRFETSSDLKYLVAVLHQKVSYHAKVLSSTSLVEVSVYDAASAVTKVQEASKTIFPQVDGDDLKFTEFFVVSNQSTPPRALFAKQTFSFLLPKGAILDSTAVQPPGTLPFFVTAFACGTRGQYCIDYPIRPGTTKIRSVYHLPWSGGISMATPLLHPVGEVSLMIPAALQFDPKVPAIFVGRDNENGFTRYVASDVHPGQSISFSLSVAHGNLQREKWTARADTLRPSSITGALSSFQPVQSPGAGRLAWITLVAGFIAALCLIALACRRSLRVAS
jgi:hypothetical protein